MNDVQPNSALGVSYEPIVLQSHYTYRKKSFIEKLNINQAKKDKSDPSNFVEGMLIINESNKKLLFRPHENPNFSDMPFYNPDFLEKMTIQFNNIKNVLFFNKKNECITIKSSESINKAYCSFMICCYDFRVFNYNRLGLYNKNEAVKFFQDLFRVIFERNMDRYKYILWKNIDPRIIYFIYHKTVSRDVNVELKAVKNCVVLTPQEIIGHKQATDNFEFGPQIIYYSQHNHSYLLVADKSSHKKLKPLLSDLSKCLLHTMSKDPVIYLLNNDSGDNNKSDIVFPINKDLTESFEKLFVLCTPRNKADFKRSDKKWLSKLSECGWLSLLNRCFQLTRVILKSLTDSESFVYMIENGCPIWGWLFGSLVQIICQPIVRTVEGFLALIAKNWILSGAYHNAAGLKPQLFLLFLDCVHQLLRCSPFLFEFNEEMLICLYDLFILSPPGFMSSQDYDFKKLNWAKFFVDPVLECLDNSYFDEEKTSGCCLNIPRVDLSDFDSFWFKMYARWIPYVQVESGSLSSRHFFMIASLDVETPVYSNYPFSLNYDKVVADNDDTRSINTVVSDEW